MNSSAPGAAIQPHMSSAPVPEKTIDAPTNAKPHWLFLAFEVCGLVGVLCALPSLIWSPPYLALGDLNEYHQYALDFWTQGPFFHQFPKEYPPLALLPFSFTLSPFSDILYYWTFAAALGVIFCLSYLWLARTVSHRTALIYMLYLLAGTFATLLMRYDLLPALATLGALMLAERKRYNWAYTLLAVGVLLKLYPAFLVPLVMAAQWRDGLPIRLSFQDIFKQTQRVRLWQRGKPILQGVGLFVALITLGFGAPLAINAQQAVSVFTYNLARPIQVESAPGSLLWLGTFFGFSARGILSFGSLNLVGPLESPLKLLSTAGLVGGSLLVYWRTLQGKLSLGQAFLAAIGVILVCNKVLSPQYLIWILPLVAYVMGLDLLWLVIALLTSLIYPFLYHFFYHLANETAHPILLWAIAIRNTFLIIAVIRAVQGKPAWFGKGQAESKQKQENQRAAVLLGSR